MDEAVHQQLIDQAKRQIAANQQADFDRYVEEFERRFGWFQSLGPDTEDCPTTPELIVDDFNAFVSIVGGVA